MANSSKCRQWTLAEAVRLGNKRHLDWSKVDARQLARGMTVEAEHGRCDPRTNVTGDDPLVTMKIALAHLYEFPDYYTRLEKMEREGKPK